MASVRARLADILKINDIGIQIREAKALAEQLNMEGKSLALVHNLLGDLLMKQSLCLKEPAHANTSIRDAVISYERAVDLASDCVETAAAYGCALISLGLYNLAEAALKKGSAIPDSKAVHPYVNHIGIGVNAGTREELVAVAKRRIKDDLLYLSVCHEDQKFKKVFRLLDNKRVQPKTVLNAVSGLAYELQHSVRAKLFRSEMTLNLLRSGIPLSNVPGDQHEESALQNALSGVEDLVADVSDSLPISRCCANLKMTLGFFDATEKEYYRALSIENPIDPRCHDIPLGRTKGVNYRDRVQVARHEVISGLMSLQGIVEEHFDSLEEKEKARFLSVRVDKVLEQNENAEVPASVYEAVEYYKTNKSWVFWRCLSSSCGSFVASTPELFLLHVVTHLKAGAAVVCHELIEKLETCNYMPNDELERGLYLAVDEDGHEVFCIKRLECLFKGIADLVRGKISETPSSDALAIFVREVSASHAEDANALEAIERLKRQLGVVPGIEIDATSPHVAVDSFINQLSSVDNEDANAFAVLETLWMNLLKICAVDKRDALLALIASIKWEELKYAIEEQIINAKVPEPDLSPENETSFQTPEMKEDTAAAHRPSHHAFKYGHPALHRRLSAISALTSPTYKKVVEKVFDPYDNEHVHKDFFEKVPHPYGLDHLVLCSVCYFERDCLRRYKQIGHHFAYQHRCVGVKCPICSVRFKTANALAYHMDYCHNENQNNQQVIGMPD